MNLKRATEVIHRLAPTYLVETIEHADQCEAASSDACSHPLCDPEVSRVRTNLYQRWSKGLRIATALRYLNSVGAIPADLTIELDAPLDAVRVTKLKARVRGLRTRSVSPPNRLLRGASLRFRMVAKYLAHHFFRSIGRLAQDNAHMRNGVLVRTWVEVTEELFPELDGSELYLLYPFSIRLRRQWDYLLRLRRRGVRFRLMGYPYSLAGLVRWLMSGQDCDLAHWERDAALQHASWLLHSYQPAKVLTTDEFEPASFVLNGHLRRGGAFVENRAHGVGRYSAWVDYDRFQVMTESQEEFYRARNPDVTYVRIGLPEQPTRALVKTVVFVDQVFRNDGSALQHFQEDILDHLAEPCRKLNLRLVVKLHPNSSVRRRHLEGEVDYISSMPEDLPHPLFLTVYSTAYLSFRTWGPTYLVQDQVFDARSVFGPNADVVNVEALAEFLERRCGC